MSILPDMLGLAVPLRILEMERRGGPTAQEREEATAFGVVLAERGDVLLFGGKKGEVADLFNRTAKAVAVLAFCPGGVAIFGRRFEAARQPGSGG